MNDIDMGFEPAGHTGLDVGRLHRGYLIHSVLFCTLTASEPQSPTEKNPSQWDLVKKGPYACMSHEHQGRPPLGRVGG